MELLKSALGNVEFTEERLEHIINFHPEVRLWRKYFTDTLSHPKIIRRSKFDPRVRIFYSKARNNKYLAIVVKCNERNFILTAYITTKIKHLSL